MRIAVVGGGLSGTLVAMRLVEALPKARVVLVEKHARHWQRGVAYSARLSRQLLNVPASRMGLHPAHREGFLEWLRVGPMPKAGPNDFVPRHFFGDFVQDEFHAFLERHPRRIERVTGEATAMTQHPRGRCFLRINTGRTIRADRVVLALGNSPPARVPGIAANQAEAPWYVDRPWKPGALAGIARHEHVLFVGAGLTMVDLLLSLREQGHCGGFTVLSRRGMLPRMHALPAAWAIVPPPIIAGRISLSQLLRWMRDEVRRAECEGTAWQNVIDSAKSHVQRCWAALGHDDRSRFLRHLRPFWEVHRHRIPEQAHAGLQDLMRAGNLQVIAGRIEQAVPDGAGLRLRYRPRGAQQCEEIRADRLINCTGPQSDARSMSAPLVMDLLAQGIASADSLGLGLQITSTGALLNQAGVASSTVFAIGPPCKAALWECTAVPEIGAQALDFVTGIANRPTPRASLRGLLGELIDRFAIPDDF